MCIHGITEGQCAFCRRLADLAARQRAGREAEAVRAAARNERERRGKPCLDAESEDYYIGLGLLAATCFIDAHVPPGLRRKFAEDYFGLTGLEAEAGDVGFTTADPNQWGISMRIYFPRRVLEMLPGLQAFAEATSLDDPGTVAVNCKRWAYDLFGMGFRIGRGHDMAIIRHSFPEGFLDAFDVGASTGQEATTNRRREAVAA